MTYAIVDEFVEFLLHPAQTISEADWPDPQVLQRNLVLASSEIDVARQTASQLTGSVSQATLEFLKLLNLVGATLLTHFDNVNFFSPEQLEAFQTWKDTNIKAIRDGEIMLITGTTPEDFPAFAVAERAWTPATAADIILNRIKRSAT